MKNFLSIFCLAISLIIFSTGCTPKEMGSKNVQITHVKTYAKCDACKYFLENSLPSKKGIVFAELDLHRETLMIKYDQTLVSTTEIKQLISDKGFWADDLKPDVVLEKQLPSCCVKPKETR